MCSDAATLPDFRGESTFYAFSSVLTLMSVDEELETFVLAGLGVGGAAASPVFGVVEDQLSLYDAVDESAVVASLAAQRAVLNAHDKHPYSTPLRERCKVLDALLTGSREERIKYVASRAQAPPRPAARASAAPGAPTFVDVSFAVDYYNVRGLCETVAGCLYVLDNLQDARLVAALNSDTRARETFVENAPCVDLACVTAIFDSSRDDMCEWAAKMTLDDALAAAKSVFAVEADRRVFLRIMLAKAESAFELYELAPSLFDADAAASALCDELVKHRVAERRSLATLVTNVVELEELSKRFVAVILKTRTFDSRASELLKTIHFESRVLRWKGFVSPVEYDLVNEKKLAWCDFNGDDAHGNVLCVDILNLPKKQLRIDVYELDSFEILSCDSDLMNLELPLDGLTPTTSYELAVESSKGVVVRVKIDLSEHVSARDVVVDVSCGKLSSRALLRPALLDVVATPTPQGTRVHPLRVVDGMPQLLENSALDGVPVGVYVDVPLSDRAPSKPPILSIDGAARIVSDASPAMEEIELCLDFVQLHFETAAVSYAVAVVRSHDEYRVPFAALSSLTAEVVCESAEGVRARTKHALSEYGGTVRFNATSETRIVSVEFTAVMGPSTARDTTHFPNARGGINSRREIASAFFDPLSMRAFALGKNGERLANAPMTIEIQSCYRGASTSFTAATDADGVCELRGDAAHVKWVRVNGTQFDMPKRVIPDELLVREGDLALPRLAHARAVRGSSGVREIVCGGSAGDTTTTLLRDLRKGTYELSHDRGTSTIVVLSPKATKTLGVVLDCETIASVNDWSACFEFLHDATTFRRYCGVDFDGDSLEVRLLTTYSSFCTPKHCVEESTSSTLRTRTLCAGHTRCISASERTLSDEALYVKERLKRPNALGNLLDRPSLLTRPHTVGTASTAVLQAQEGSGFGGPPMAAKAGSRMMKKKMKRREMCDEEEFDDDYACCEMDRAYDAPVGGRSIPTPDLSFLSQESVVVDETHVAKVVGRGTGYVDLQVFDDREPPRHARFRARSLFVNGELACRDVASISASAVQTTDVRNRDDRPLGEHWIEMPTLGGDSESGISDVSEYLALARSLRSDWNSPLDDFPIDGEFEKKKIFYDKNACCELDLWLRFRDGAFFDAVVLPALRDKSPTTTVDAFLLGDDARLQSNEFDERAANDFELMLRARTGSARAQALLKRRARADAATIERQNLRALDAAVAVAAQPQPAPPPPVVAAPGQAASRRASPKPRAMYVPTAEPNILAERDYLDIPRGGASFWLQCVCGEYAPIDVSTHPLFPYSCDSTTAAFLASALIALPVSFSKTMRRVDDVAPSSNWHVDQHLDDEILRDRICDLRTVISNKSNAAQVVRVDVSIPRGCVAVGMCGFRKVLNLSFKPFETKTLTHSFYAPSGYAEEEDAPLYPAHLYAGVNLFSWNSARACRIVNTLKSRPNDLAYVLDDASTAEEVMAYFIGGEVSEDLSTPHLASKLSALRSPEVWRVVSEALRLKVGLSDAELYPLRHLAFTAFAHVATDEEIRAVAPPLGVFALPWYPYKDEVDNSLEFEPLINARVLELGERRVIPCAQLAQAYEKALSGALFARRPYSRALRLKIGLLLMYADRVEDSFCVMKPLLSKHTGCVQLDYAYCYFAGYGKFSIADAVEVARARSQNNTLSKRWTDRFKKVLAVGSDVAAGESVSTALSVNEEAKSPCVVAVEDDGVVLHVQLADIRAATTLRVRFYALETEARFSASPFGVSEGDEFSFVAPVRVSEAVLSAGVQVVDVPILPATGDVACSLSFVGVSSHHPKKHSVLRNSLRVSIDAKFGQITVCDSATRAPVPRAYIKVYARRGATSTFHKDGYTDLRGRFDYVSLNTPVLDVTKFALLIASDTRGRVVRVVDGSL